MHRQPGRMTQEPTNRHLVLLRQLILRHLPGTQLLVDVLIKIELSLIDQPKHPHRRHRLADRAGLKQSFGRNPFFPLFICEPIALRSNDPPLRNNRQRQSRNPLVAHLLCNNVINLIRPRRRPPAANKPDRNTTCNPKKSTHSLATPSSETQLCTQNLFTHLAAGR
jgi:hypothetical protein